MSTVLWNKGALNILLLLLVTNYVIDSFCEATFFFNVAKFISDQWVLCSSLECGNENLNV